MIYIRSFFFNASFFLWTILCSFYCFFMIPFGSLRVIKAARSWGEGVRYLMRWILNITVEIRGRENLPEDLAAIIACKHQSAWETTYIQNLAFNSAVILKRELVFIPIFGQVLLAAGAIQIDRSKGKSVLPELIKSAKKQLKGNRKVFIFPEGTRSAAGKPGKYKSGIFKLYEALNLPVVPIAHNAGYFWPRRGFLKKPGVIIVEILPQIDPGLAESKFMPLLEQTIETSCAKITPTNT